MKNLTKGLTAVDSSILAPKRINRFGDPDCAHFLSLSYGNDGKMKTIIK